VILILESFKKPKILLILIKYPYNVTKPFWFKPTHKCAGLFWVWRRPRKIHAIKPLFKNSGFLLRIKKTQARKGG